MNTAVKYKNQKSPGHNSLFTNTSRSLFGNIFFACGSLLFTATCYTLYQ